MNCWRRIARKRRPDRPPPNVNRCLLIACLTPAEKPAGVRFVLYYNTLPLRTKSFSQVKPDSGRIGRFGVRGRRKRELTTFAGQKMCFFRNSRFESRDRGPKRLKRRQLLMFSTRRL